MAILEIKNVDKYFGGTVALKNINLEIEEGKITGLLGPNGSGKTTLIKIVAGLLNSYKGICCVDGKKVGKYTKALVSYLPDRICLPDWMNVNQLMDLYEDFYEDFQRNKASRMISELGIDSKQSLKQMSKGTKEKLQLIMVMSRNAKVYLLDEPLSGVDPATRDYILNTIIKNYNPEAAVVVSTHLISDVENILDDVVLINKGEIVAHSTVDDIREQQGKSVDEYFREVFRI